MVEIQPKMSIQESHLVATAPLTAQTSVIHVTSSKDVDRINDLKQQLKVGNETLTAIFQHKQKGYGQIKFDAQQLNRAILD
jgi:hypothetical protein